MKLSDSIYSIGIVAITSVNRTAHDLTDRPREELTGLLTAAIVILSVSMADLAYWQMPVIVALLTVIVVANKFVVRPGLVVSGLGALLIGSAWWASVAAPSTQQGPTGSLALLMTIYGALIFVPHTMAFWRWLERAVILHAVAIMTLGALGTMRPMGFAQNPNPAAGLLVLILALRWSRVAAREFEFPHIVTLRRIEMLRTFLIDGILIAAIVQTGSRWAIITMAVVGLVILIHLRPTLREVAVWLAPGVLVAAVLLASTIHTAYPGLRLDRDVASDLAVRLDVSSAPQLIPQGLIPLPSLHTAPIRIAVEFGVLAAAAWISLTLLAVYRSRASYILWPVAAMIVLSVMDYYFVYGVLLPLWWIMASWRPST